MDSTVAAILAGHVFAGIGGMIVKGNLFEPRCLRRIWTCLWQKVVACAAGGGVLRRRLRNRDAPLNQPAL